jgi:hypothetical protein
MGIPFYGFSADGVSIAHEDGNGWYVAVEAKLPFIGKLVEYSGDVYVNKLF